MSKLIDPVTGKEVKRNEKWKDISGRRWNQITYYANRGISYKEISPALSDAEVELYESIVEDLVEYRKKYGENFIFDECAEVEW